MLYGWDNEENEDVISAVKMSCKDEMLKQIELLASF